jgi:hypothetical protein
MALRLLPPVGENASGPLGPGLLSSGLLGKIIGDLQARVADFDHARTTNKRQRSRYTILLGDALDCTQSVLGGLGDMGRARLLVRR